MKNLGKISLVAGLATALIVLLRKRRDGTRMLDDVTNQVSKWANMLMSIRDNVQGGGSGHKGPANKQRQGTRMSAAAGTGGSGGHTGGDRQE